MIKTLIRLVLLAGIILPTLPSQAQFTNVTATVKDPAGNTYTNCSYSVDFVNRSQQPQLPLLGGVSQFQTSFPGARCDSFGNLAIRVADNNQVTPNDVVSNWRFSICDQTQKACFVAQLLITGASQDISTALQAVSAPLPGTAFGNISTGNIIATGNISATGNVAAGGTLSVTGGTTLNGGTLNGTYAGNPTLSGNLSIGGTLGVASNVTETTGQNQYKAFSLNNVLWVDGIHFTTMAGCYAALSAGGVCHLPPGYSETLSSSITMNKNNAGFVFDGAATITMGSNQIIVSPTTNGAYIVSNMELGGNQTGAAGIIGSTGVRFIYTGTGTAFLVGGATASPATSSVKFRGFTIDLTGAGSAAIGMDWLNVHGGCRLENVFFNGSGGTATQVGLQLDAGGNFTGDCWIADNWFTGVQTGINAAGASTGDVQEVAFYNNIFFAGATSSTAYAFNWSFSNWIFGGTISSFSSAVTFTGNSQGNHGWISTNGTTVADVAFGTSSNNEVECTNVTPCVTTDNGTNNKSRQSGSDDLSEQPTSAALTGNSADQTYYTYTLTANKLGPGKCLDVEVWANHSTGTASTVYKLFFGATAVVSNTSTGSGQIYHKMHVCNNTNSVTAQNSSLFSIVPTSTIATITFSPVPSAENTAGAVVIKATFNVANTDQLTPGHFSVHLVP